MLRVAQIQIPTSRQVGRRRRALRGPTRERRHLREFLRTWASLRAVCGIFLQRLISPDPETPKPHREGGRSSRAGREVGSLEV